MHADCLDALLLLWLSSALSMSLVSPWCCVGVYMLVGSPISTEPGP